MQAYSKTTNSQLLQIQKLGGDQKRRQYIFCFSGHITDVPSIKCPLFLWFHPKCFSGYISPFVSVYIPALSLVTQLHNPCFSGYFSVVSPVTQPSITLITFSGYPPPHQWLHPRCFAGYTPPLPFLIRSTLFLLLRTPRFSCYTPAVSLVTHFLLRLLYILSLPIIFTD
jgi:hypothetical protein